MMFLGTKVDYSNVIAYVDGFYLFETWVTFTVSDEGVIAFSSPTPAPSESASPSYSPTTKSPTTNVTVLINFDTYSSVEISWRILEIDTGRVVREAPIGTYGPFDGDIITDTILLELDGKYTFEVSDQAGDGLCCSKGEGYVEIFFGTETLADRIILFDRGDFTFSNSQNFTVSLDATIPVTQSPSSTPTTSAPPSASVAPTVPMIDIVIEIRLDQ
jgi:hypothetical protein